MEFLLLSLLLLQCFFRTLCYGSPALPIIGPLTPGLSPQTVRDQEGHTVVEKIWALGNILVLSLGSKVVEKLFNYDGPSKMGIKINFLKSLS